MTDGLDVIVVDDEPSVSRAVTGMVKACYVWGDVHGFTDPDEAIAFCLGRDAGAAIFVLDVFMGNRTGFDVLDAVAERYPMACSDAIEITGAASEDVVDMCLASDVHHLLEKPIKRYELELALRAIVAKYLKFARRLLSDSSFAETVARVKVGDQAES